MQFTLLMKPSSFGWDAHRSELNKWHSHKIIDHREDACQANCIRKPPHLWEDTCAYQVCKASSCYESPSTNSASSLRLSKLFSSYSVSMPAATQSPYFVVICTSAGVARYPGRPLTAAVGEQGSHSALCEAFLKFYDNPTETQGVSSNLGLALIALNCYSCRALGWEEIKLRSEVRAMG